MNRREAAALAQKQRRFVTRQLPVPVRRFFFSVGWRVFKSSGVFVCGAALGSSATGSKTAAFYSACVACHLPFLL